jgi:hypothetical protein
LKVELAVQARGSRQSLAATSAIFGIRKLTRISHSVMEQIGSFTFTMCAAAIRVHCAFESVASHLRTIAWQLLQYANHIPTNIYHMSTVFMGSRGGAFEYVGFAKCYF